MDREVSREYKEDVFKDARIIALESVDQFDAYTEPARQMTEDRYKDLYEQVRYAVAKLKADLAMHMSEQEREELGKLVTFLRSTPPTWFDKNSEQIKPMPERLASALPKNFPKQNIANLRFNDLFDGWKGRVQKYEGPSISKVLNEIGGKKIVSCSDSHRSTGAMFAAMARQGFFESGESMATLIFDHHPDFGSNTNVATLKESLRFDKEDIAMSLLMHGLVQSTAVVGVSKYFKKMGSIESPRLSLFFGEDLYKANKPKTDLLDAKLDPLFSGWKETGIKKIYTSVDLDSLRLDEMGYTGVDYSRERAVRRFVTNFKPMDLHQMFSDGQVPLQRLTQIKDSIMRFIAANGDDLYGSYNGVPARWISHTVRRAKAEGFEIGITHPTDGRVVVGDVTELHPDDTGGKTARIASAILKELLQAA